MSNYRPPQSYGPPAAQDPYQRPGSTNYGGQQPQQQPQQAVGGYATPPPGNQWQHPPPPQNAANQQSQYGAQGQQTAASAYNPGIYGGMPGGQTQLPGPPPTSQTQTYYGQQPQQPPQQQAFSYGGQPPVGQAQQQHQQQYGHTSHASVSSIAPSVYHQEDPQNAQNWPQPLHYSTHPPVDRYGPHAGQQGSLHSNQQPQSHQLPPAPHYDASAPPPPSATPGGSYFPPSHQAQQIQHPGASVPGVPGAALNAYSQDDGQQDIPPSLSGQGVAAYIPTNTNPAPGVYIPPPPENVPAWSQRPHEPLDPNFRKFKYTPRPPPKPQEYGSQPPVGQYENAQQGYPPPPPPQAPPSMQTYNQGAQQAQQVQQYPNPGTVQQPPQGMAHGQLLQDQYQSGQGQPLPGSAPQQYQQQHQTHIPPQHSPAQAFTAPMQTYNSGSRPQSQYGQAQAWNQGQHPNSRPGSVQQAQQPYGPPQHSHSSSISQAALPHQQRLYQEEATPVSPLQSRQSISLENPHEPRYNASGVPSRSESQVSRKSIPLRPIQEPQPEKSVSSTIKATALGGFGGPSDWEHFGMGADEIDDTAMYGVKSDGNAPHSPPMASVELPTGSPVRGKRSSSDVSAPDDWRPSPAVVPVNSQRPASIVGLPSQQPPANWVPTPPVPHSIQQQAMQASSPPPQASNAVIMDDPDYIPPMPNTPPLVGARLNERKPIVLGGSTVTHPAPPTSTSFVMGDTVSIPPSQPQIPQHQQQSGVPHYQQAPQPIATATGSGFAVSNDGNWQQNQTATRDVTPQLRSTTIDTQTLHNAQQEVQELQARLASAEAALSERDSILARKESTIAQKDSSIAQKDALIHQMETTLRDMTEKLELQTQVASKHEEEAVKMRAEKTALEEQVARKESTLTAAKSAYDFEKAELEKKTKEVQTALAAATTEIVELKKQLEDEKVKASAPVDMAPGLDPWFKGSLERYKEMLYTESKPLPEKERLNVFMGFVNDESRLRGVELPFGPAGQVKGFPQQQQSQPSSPPRTKGAPVPEPKQTTGPQLPHINSSPNSEGFVMVDSDEDIQYSPGGRPIMRPKLKKAASVRSVNSAPESGAAELPAAEAVADAQPSASNAKPMAYQPFRRNTLETPIGAGAPTSLGGNPAKPPSQIATGPKQPAYMKFAYQPGEQGTPNPVSQNTPAVAPPPVPPAKEPIYKPLSQWTQPAPATQSQPKKPPKEEKPIQRQLVEERRSSQDAPMVPQPLKPKGPPSQPHPAASTGETRPVPKQQRSFVSPMEHLASLLPPVKIPDSETASRDLQGLRKTFASFPSDYEFISSLTKTWETEATTMRSRHEAERRKRQQALEKRTNELYDDDEIGYGDFDTLESQAKEEEQHLKAKEDVEEYDSYGQRVFEPVYRTLQDQIGGLMELFDAVHNLVTRSRTGLEALSQRPEDTDLAEAMALLIQVHTSLEERHTEVAKAVQDRDRRYKRTQTKPLYAKGDITAMKRVEKGFEQAEKSNEVKMRIEKAERCKRLCRIVEANMERGIGINEDFAHEILGVSEEGAAIIKPEDRQEFEDLVKIARDVLREVYGNTTRLLRHFEFMDMELNECEYSVSVASARLKGDPESFFQRLEREKMKEDGKLKDEWTGRVGEVEEHAKEADAQIGEVLGRLRGGQARAGPASGLSALEEAKRRNGEL